MTTPDNRFMRFGLLISVAVLVVTGCRNDKLNFEPAPKPAIEDEDEDEGA